MNVNNFGATLSAVLAISILGCNKPADAVADTPERPTEPAAAVQGSADTSAVVRRTAALEAEVAGLKAKVKALEQSHQELSDNWQTLAKGYLALMKERKAATSQPPPTAPASASASGPLTFGTPTVKRDSMGTGMTVLVEVTNRRNRQVTCTLTGAFKRADRIVTTATGMVNQLAPGATRTVELMSMDDASGADVTLRLEATTCF